MPAGEPSNPNHAANPWLETTPRGESRIVLAQILETIPHFVFWKDRQSRYLGCNQNFATVAGREKPEDLVGLTDYDMFWKKEESDFFVECDQKVMASGEPLLNIEEPQLQRDGSEKWMLTNKVPLRNDEGQIIGLLGMFADITDRKLAEAEREQLNQELIRASREAGKAEVATSVLHNVGNALNSLTTCANVAQDHCQNNASQLLATVAAALAPHKNNFADYVQSDPKAAHLPALLDELSDQISSQFAAINNEINTLKTKLHQVEAVVQAQQSYAKSRAVHLPVNAEQLLQDALHVSDTPIDGGSTETHLCVEPGTPECITDPHAVLQILVNFITNAKQAMDRLSTGHPHQLTLRAKPGVDSETVCFSIQDTGIGIEQANLVRVFQHGFTTKADGQGFGLHAAANTAQALGGRVEAFSEGQGQGATFVLTLPIQPPDQAESSPSNPDKNKAA